MKIKKDKQGNIVFSVDSEAVAYIKDGEMIVTYGRISRPVKVDLNKKASLYKIDVILYDVFVGSPLSFRLIAGEIPVLECNNIIIGSISDNHWYPDFFTGLPDPVVSSALAMAEEYIGAIKGKPLVGNQEPSIFEFQSGIKATTLIKIKNTIRKVFQ